MLFFLIGHFSTLTAPFRISIMPANSISVAVKSASSFLLIVVAATWPFSFSAVQLNFSFEINQTVSEGRVRLPSRACVVLMSPHTQKQYECHFAWHHLHFFSVAAFSNWVSPVSRVSAVSILYKNVPASPSICIQGSVHETRMSGLGHKQCCVLLLHRLTDDNSFDRQTLYSIQYQYVPLPFKLLRSHGS